MDGPSLYSQRTSCSRSTIFTGSAAAGCFQSCTGLLSVVGSPQPPLCVSHSDSLSLFLILVKTMTSGHRLMVVAFVAFGGPRASHCICCTPPVVRSSCWLADGASPVAAIQAAIGCSGAQMVVVDNIGAPWLLDVGLNLNSSNQVMPDHSLVFVARLSVVTDFNSLISATGCLPGARSCSASSARGVYGRGVRLDPY